MGKAAASGNIFQLIVTAEAIAGKVPGKSFQECFRMVSAPAGLVIIQADWRQPVFSGSIQPHVGPGLCCFPVLLQHLAGRFIRMDDIPFQQMFMKSFIYRRHVVQAALDDPVGQRRPPKLHTQLFPVCSLKRLEAFTESEKTLAEVIEFLQGNKMSED